MTSESDIVEDLHSADPECEPSATKIIMGRAADEIERLRQAVAGERAAILVLVEGFARVWDQDDNTSWHEAAKRIAAAIKARALPTEMQNRG
jgi:hypothetical protein